MTGGIGGAAAAFAGALIAGVKTAAISGAVAAGTSAVLTAAKSVGSGDDVGTTLKKLLQPPLMDLLMALCGAESVLADHASRDM